MTLSEKLMALRKKQGLSQSELAEALHISRQAISRWESGQAVPSIDNLKYLSDLYGVSVDYLLSTRAEPQAPDSVPAAPVPAAPQAKKGIFLSRKILAAMIALVLALAAALIGCIVHYEKEEPDIVPYEEMALETGDISFQGTFSLNW